MLGKSSLLPVYRRVFFDVKERQRWRIRWQCLLREGGGLGRCAVRTTQRSPRRGVARSSPADVVAEHGAWVCDVVGAVVELPGAARANRRLARCRCPRFTAFLSWQRNGRTVEHRLAESDQPPAGATLEVRLAALISFYRWHQAVSGVAVAGRLFEEHRDTDQPGACWPIWMRVRPRRRRRWCGCDATDVGTGRPCCCRNRFRRSWMAVRSSMPSPDRGKETCETGLCSPCWPKPASSRGGTGPADRRVRARRRGTAYVEIVPRPDNPTGRG